MSGDVCAWCQGSLVYTHDPEQVLCTNCMYYIKKQHPELYRPCLRANLVRLRGMAHRHYCALLLYYEYVRARDYLRPKDFEQWQRGHGERLRQHHARFGWLEGPC